MIISAIVACDLQMTIGKDGSMPWHLPGDLRYFVRKTMGKPMIMGRRTFQTLPGPLKGRLNIVLTRDEDFHAAGVSVAHSVEEALEIADAGGDHEELMILGGAGVYAEFLPRLDRLYLTVIHHRFEGGDTFFPAFELEDWAIQDVEHHDADEKNAYAYSFYQLDRTSQAPARVHQLDSPHELPEPLQTR